MFCSSHRSSLGGATGTPGVGDYDLRVAGGAYAFRPGTSPFGSAAKRQPMGGAAARGVPPPTQYVGHADPFAHVTLFGDTRRKAMGEPNGVPGVGAYSLSRPFFVAGPPRRVQHDDGAQQRGSTSIPSPRRDGSPSPRRRDLEAAQAAAEAAAQAAEAQLAAEEGLGFGAGAASARSTAAAAAAAAGGGGGASFGSVARAQADPVADARANALAAALAAAAAAVPLPDLRSHPRQSALPFSAAPRFGNDETLAPGPGAYELKAFARNEHGAMPFNSRPAQGGALAAPRTGERVGPGAYDFERSFKFSPRSVPVEQQCFDAGAARDPMGLDLSARLNKGAPGVGDYDIAASRGMQRIARDARAKGDLFVELGSRRRAREAEIDAQLYRYRSNVAQATLSNGLSPRVVEPSAPLSPRPRGFAVPGFDKSSLRKGAFDTVDGPGPSDYFAERQNAQRIDAARACTANTAFSTSKRPGGGWGDELGSFEVVDAALGDPAAFGSDSTAALSAHGATLEALSPRSRPATRADLSSRGESRGSGLGSPRAT